MTHYVAGRLVWHSREDRYVEAGQRVDAGHLTPDEIMMLETMDPPALVAVEAAPEPAQPAPDSGQED